MQGTSQIEIEGRSLKLSNLDKILYPENKFTKGQVIDYYIRASRWLLPHFENRPVTLNRFPNGIGGHHFYEKDTPRFTPDWVTRFPVPRRAGGPAIQYILINDVATLVWCANAASLELHPFLHRAPRIEQPTSIVFDLDPGSGCRHAGLRGSGFSAERRARRNGLGVVCEALRIERPANLCSVEYRHNI